MNSELYFEPIRQTLTGAVADAGLTPVGDPIILDGSYPSLSFRAEVGSDSLVDFALQVLVHPNAGWADYLTGADWAAAPWGTNKYRRMQNDPTALAFGAESFVNIEVGCPYSIRFLAQAVALATPTVTIYASLGRGGI
jgi:hypothetical protein